jgi:AMMECR1 domain-containing protein
MKKMMMIEAPETCDDCPCFDFDYFFCGRHGLELRYNESYSAIERPQVCIEKDVEVEVEEP